MGKVGRWIRSIFGSKKSASSGSGSRNQSENYVGSYSDANKHAIAVAAATAAVAEAALAAAHAAAEVVRLTTGGSNGGGSKAYHGAERRREAAAVKIQSAFRAYLARRALRALKGLVKLQALVRGHIVRKQSANMLRRMQAMARVQARACANRADTHRHPRSSSMSNARGSFGRHTRGSNWLENWMEENAWDDDKSDKILEVDTWKPRLNPSPRTPTKPQKPTSLRTAENSPRAYSRPGSSHKRSPFSPAASSSYSRSLLGEYPSHPNYMANTRSSQAKLRSHSAPRQRTRFEKSGFGHSDTVSKRGLYS